MLGSISGMYYKFKRTTQIISAIVFLTSCIALIGVSCYMLFVL